MDCFCVVLLIMLGFIYSYEDIAGLSSVSGMKRFGLPVGVLLVAIPRLCCGHFGVKRGKRGLPLLVVFGTVSVLELGLDFYAIYHENFISFLSTNNQAHWLGWAAVAAVVRIAVI